MFFILENLAIGSFQDAQSAFQQNINAFLNVAEELDLALSQEILYHKIPIKDFFPIPPEKLKEAVDWIAKHIDKYKILVFCNAGIGRSSSVVISYLCSIGFGFGEAVEFVARKKPDISILPNLIKTIEEVLKAQGKN